MPRGFFSYAKNSRIFVPDVQVTEKVQGHVYAALRGYCASLAVLDASGTCVGWIDTRVLGYERASDWLRAQSDKRGD